MNEVKSLLLSHSYRKWGYISIFVGLVFTYINSYTQIRIESPVLAIYSGFLEQSFFKISHTNLTDEFAMTFLFLGFLILIITKEKIENEQTVIVRHKALLYSFITNNVLLIMSVLLIYGVGFVGVLIVGLYSQAIIYLICFAILKSKNKEFEN